MSGNSFNRFFLKFFPPPNFLATPSFGLDISDESLKFAELIVTKNGIRIGRYGERIIPPGVIESGKIKDSKRMEEILFSLRKETGVKSVRVSLPEEQIYLFQLRLEKTGLKSVKEGIELALEEHVPIPAQDAIFDYDLIKEDAQSLEVQVVTIPKNIIENYLSIFEHSQIAVQSFELEAQAVSRAVIKKGDLETYMIVDFGKKRTGIFIISRGVVMFTFTLDIGGKILNNMIQKNFNISVEEAEKMKKQFGLQRNAANKEIFAVLLNSVSVLRDEIARHFLYWQTHKDEEGKNNPPIKKIILCGGDSNLIGLADYISISMKNPVEMANVWTNIANTENYIPEMSFRQALSFATTLGLALGDFENQQFMINLVPKAEKKKIATDFFYRLAALFLMTLNFCILVAFISIIPSYFLSSVKDASVNMKLEIQKNEPLPLFDQQTLDTIKDINNKLDLVEKAEKNRFPISEKIIRAVLLKKRPDIKITQILYENNPTQGKKISILGTAPSREVLLLFRQALENDPTFKNIDLPISNFVKGSNIQFYLSLIPL